MKRQILAITVGIALTAAVLTPALSSNNQAFAQVTAESRVLQAILGLTDQIKQQTTETKAKYQDIILDLNLKKKFYHITGVAPTQFVGVFNITCNNPDWPQCAFNVEPIQFSGNGCVDRIEVDAVSTDIEPNICAPTNLPVDSGIGKIGAHRSVFVFFEDTYSGPVEFNGEKPQGMEIFLDLF